MNTDGVQMLQRIDIKDIQIQILPQPIKSIVFTLPDTIDIPITVENPSQFTITIPNDPSVNTHITTFTESAQARNCFLLGSGIFSKKIASAPNIGPYARYSSHNASSCDWKEINAPFISSGAILSLQTRNINGRPLKICVKIDPNGYCILEDMLQEEKNTWHNTSFIIPANKSDKFNRYTIELDNLAVGNEERINDIGPIIITGIPYTWISEIALQPFNAASSSEQNETKYSPLTVNHPNPTYYTIQIPPIKSGLGNEAATLMLFQSFDKGWKAYDISSCIHFSDNKILRYACTLFPFFFGNEVKKHILINNWNNGWTLPTTYDRKQMTISLFFIPQLLEWFGFLILPIPFLVIFCKRSQN